MLKGKKNAIRWALAAILLIDLVLVGLIWQMAASPQSPQNSVALLRRQHALLAADIARADKIRAQLPEVQRQDDAFFHQDIRPMGTAYSMLISDLGDIAKVSGLQAENYSFHQHDVDKHGIVQLDIYTSVSGDYKSVVKFIDTLERSDNFYVLDGLSLASDTAGQLRLNLQLRTFFRTT